MGVGEFVLGFAHLTVVLASVCGAAALVLRGRLPVPPGAVRAVAFGILATAGAVAVHVIPGFLGILSRGSVLVAAGLLLALAWRLGRDRRPPEPLPGPEPPPSGRVSRVVAGAAAAIAVVASVGYALSVRLDAVSAIDMLNFHLPGVARWIQTGSMWGINDFVPLQSHGTYPNNGDVILLGLVLPWRNDAFVRFAELPFLALTAVAVYALACELGARRAAAVTFAAALVSAHTVLEPALVAAMPDATMLATFSAGVLFLVRHARGWRMQDLVLAGTGLGLAFGTKWYAVSSVAAVLVVWGLVLLVAGRRPLAVARAGAALSALVAVFGGVWFVRNLLASGNPVFPVKLDPLGVLIFDAPPDVLREAGGFTIAHYAGDPGVWESYILPSFERRLGLAGAVIGTGLLVALAILLVRRLRSGALDRGSGAVLGVALGALLLALVYTLTPYSAFGPEGRPINVDSNTRYLVPAMLPAAALAAWGAGRMGRLGPLLELAALAAVVDGVARALDLAAGDVAAAVAVTAAAGAGAWGLTMLVRGGRLLPAAAVATIALTAVGLAAYRSQSAFNDARYEQRDSVLNLLRKDSGSRIGLAGQFYRRSLSPIYPAFGPRLRNEVVFVGPRVREMLRAYPGRDSFAAGLAEERPALLVVGTGYFRSAAEVAEAAWARSAGYREVARSARLILLAPAAGSVGARDERAVGAAPGPLAPR